MNFKKLLCACTAMLLFVSGCGKEDEVSEVPPVEEVETLMTNEIYVEPLNATPEQIHAYNELCAALDGNDMAEIAKQVTISFAYDFFSLKNKASQDEVGGITYLPDDRAEEFKTYAIAHYYQNYPTVVNEYGADSLPSVKNVTVSSVVAQSVTYLDIAFSGYVVDATIEYDATKIDDSALKTNIKATLIDSSGVIVLIGIE